MCSGSKEQNETPSPSWKPHVCMSKFNSIIVVFMSSRKINSADNFLITGFEGNKTKVGMDDNAAGGVAAAISFRLDTQTYHHWLLI